MKNKQGLSSFLLVASLFIFSCIQSQNKAKITADPKEAKEKLDKGNFNEALKSYLSLIEKDPKNEEYNYNIAVCYLNTNINKSKAIPYLEIITRKEKYNSNAMYFLGLAYHYAYRFDEAIKAYNKFKETGKGESDYLKMVDRQIQCCINAKELMKFPVNVTFENLGKNINSPYPDYYPFVPTDESFILFNSKRNVSGAVKDVEGDGSYMAGICISKINNGEYSKAKNIGPPINNGTGDEEIVGMSGSGEIVLIWRYDLELGIAGVFMSTADKNKNFRKAEMLDKRINLQDQQIFASISNDGNTLYFSSIKLEGEGGNDIYMIKKLPNGNWGNPVNLGDEVNTPEDEDFPNISSDGKTLYFSSNGHIGMGGFDIFKAEWNDETKKFNKIKNIGYPVNTPEDNMNFRISETGRYGYISALREGGIGDLDIYKVIFKDVEPKYAIIKGNISSADTSKKISYGDIFITVTDDISNEIYGNYLPNSSTGNYVIIVQPGSYNISIELAGFDIINEDIKILDKSQIPSEINKNYTLMPGK